MSIDLTPFGSGSRRHVGHSRQRQRRLEEYETTAPVAQRLAGFRGQSDSQRIDPGSSRQLSEPALHHRHPSSSRKAFSVSRESLNEHERKWHQQTTHRKRKNEDQPTEDTIFEENRKRLLRQQDWIGLGHARPLMVKFASRQSGIGKRRKANSDTRKRQACARNSDVPRPVIDTRNTYSVAFMSGAIVNQPESIDVRIGTAALQSQASPTAEIAEISRQSPGALQGSPDQMLFDEPENIELQRLPAGVNAGFVEEDASRVEVVQVEDQDESGIKELLDSLSVHPSSYSGDQPAFGIDQGSSGDEGSDIRYDLSRKSAHGGRLSPHLEGKMHGHDSMPMEDETPPADNLQIHTVGEGQVESLDDHDNDHHPITPKLNANKLGFETYSLLPPSERHDLESSSSQKLAPTTQDDRYSESRNPNDIVSPEATGIIRNELGFRRYLSLSASESGSWIGNSCRQQPNQPTFAEATFSAPVARMFPLSQRATAGSSLSIGGERSLREIESTVRGLQSPSASLRNIVSLAELPPAEPREKRDEAVSEEIWKRFVFGSNDGCDSQSDSGAIPASKPNNSGEESHASSISVEVGTTGATQSVFQLEMRTSESPLPERQGSSLFVQGITSSPENIPLRDGYALGTADLTNLSDWGSGTDEIDEVRLENNALTSGYQANIHAGTAASQSAKDGRRMVPSMSRSSMYNIVPTSDGTGASSAVAPGSTAAQASESYHHANLNMPSGDTGMSPGQHNSSSAARSAPARAPHRRIIFTKPSPFRGTSGAVRELGPMHIGRKHAGKTRIGRSALSGKVKSATRRQIPSVYDFPVSTSDEEIEG